MVFKKKIEISPLAAEPVYRQIADALRNAILSGELKEGDRLPPEAEFAASLSVNSRTLRKGLAILSAQKLITQTRGRGTLISFPQRKLTRIGLAVGSDAIPYGPYTLRMLSEIMRCSTTHPEIQLTILPENDPETISTRIQETRCDALIISIPTLSFQKKLCEPEFDSLPMVFINSHVEDLARFGRYEVRTARGSMGMGVEKLFEMGHRRIAFVSQEASPKDFVMATYYQDFLAACKKYRLSTRYARLGKITENWYDIGRDLTMELFSSEKRPTSILTPGITFSSGAWQGLSDLGLKIPDDVSFIGTNPIEACNPNMSGLFVPIRKIAEKAVDLVLDQFVPGKHLKQKTYEFPVEFIDAGSCRPLQRTCNI